MCWISYESDEKNNNFNISFVSSNFIDKKIISISHVLETKEMLKLLTFLSITFVSIQHVVLHVVLSVNAVDNIKINKVICYTFKTIGIPI